MHPKTVLPLPSLPQLFFRGYRCFLGLFGGGGIMIATAILVIAQTGAVEEKKENTKNKKGLPPCSPAKVNSNCVITIDRDRPASPLPIRLSKNSNEVTIQMQLRPLEKIKRDAVFNEVAKPDPLSSIFSASFFSSLGKIVLKTLNVPFIQPTPPKPEEELGDIIRVQELEGKKLICIKDHIKAVNKKLDALQDAPKDECDLRVGRIITLENELANEITRPPSGNTVSDAILTDVQGVCSPPDRGVGIELLPIQEIKDLKDIASEVAKKYHGVTSLYPLLNQINANQAALSSALKTVQEAQKSLLLAADIMKQQATDLQEKIDKGLVKASDNLIFTYVVSSPARNGVDYSATIKLSSQNMITNVTSSSPLATVNLVWGSSPLEISAGVLFSTLPARSFQNSPILVGGRPSGSSQIAETLNKPLIVPIALVHYRVQEWVPSVQRFAWLFSGGIGVNTYSGTADFAIGTTLAYRRFMVTPLVHFARDLRLTKDSGLVAGSAYTPALTGNPPTERFWTARFGIAISVGTPIN